MEISLRNRKKIHKLKYRKKRDSLHHRKREKTISSKQDFKVKGPINSPRHQKALRYKSQFISNITNSRFKKQHKLITAITQPTGKSTQQKIT